MSLSRIFADLESSLRETSSAAKVQFEEEQPESDDESDADSVTDSDSDSTGQYDSDDAGYLRRRDLWETQLPLHTLLQRTLVTSPADDPGTSDTAYRSTAKGQIRILELAPGQHDHKLEGRLIYVDLEVGESSAHASEWIGRPLKTSYTAISYCWGPFQLSDDLSLQGHLIKITPTVSTILRTQRHGTDYVRLWIDQVCINQDDIHDKEAQIGLMSTIYARASNTFVWLGEGPEDDALASLRLLDDFVHQSHESDSFAWTMRHLRKMLDESKGSKEINALAKLFEQSWFHRTWVIQEVVCSKEVFILYGGKAMSWQDFSTYCINLYSFEIFGTSEAVVGSLDAAMKTVADIGVAKRSFQTARTGTSLMTLLINTRYASVTLPVDKVYGIIGMSTSELSIDYSKTPSQLFAEVAILLLSQEFAWKVLASVDHEQHDTTMPSWIPDWSRERATVPLADSNYALLYYGADSSYGKNEVAVTSDRRALSAEAVFVDDLQDVSEVTVEAELSSQSTDQSNASLRHAIDFFGRSSSATRSGYQVFCATLVAGRDGQGLAAFPRQYPEVFSLLCDEVTGSTHAVPGQTYSARQQSGELTFHNLAQGKHGETFTDLRKAYRNAMLNRRLGWTIDQKFVLLPRHAQPGDRVAVLLSCPVPYVLRPVEGNSYKFIGECYLHEVMNSRWLSANSDDLEVIRIV